jgi:hypothetical protein
MSNTLFEKYKRWIYLGLTLFALVTFSITGAIYAFFGQVGKPAPGSIVLPATKKRVPLTETDLYYGQLLSRLQSYSLSGRFSFPAFIFNGMSMEGNTEPKYSYGILRRVAIEGGLDVSDDEIKIYKERVFKNAQISPFDLAVQLRLGNESTLDEVIREAIRISIYVRSEILAAVELGDAALGDYIKKERKLVTLSHVDFEAGPKQKEWEKKPPKDEVLLAWVKKLDSAKQLNLGFVDDTQVRFDGMGLVYAKGDPAEWKEELKDFTAPAEEDLRARYNQDRDQLYVREEWKKKEAAEKAAAEKEKQAKKDKKDQPAKKDQEAKKDKDGGLLQDPPKPKTSGDSSSDKSPGKGKNSPKQGGEATVPTPEQAKYKSFEEVRADIERRIRLEAGLRKLLDRARKAAEEFVNKAKGKDPKKGNETSKSLKDFDFKTWFAEAVKGRKGILFMEPKPLANPESYSDLGAIGKWEQFWLLRNLDQEGTFLPDIQRTNKAAFFIRLLERKTNVLRPLGKIRNEVRKAYAETEAMEWAKKQAKSFKDSVQKKAESLAGEAFGKIRKKIETEVKKQIADWKKSVSTEIKTLQEKVNSDDIPERAVSIYRKTIEDLQASLKKEEEKTKAIRKEVETSEKKEIHDVLLPFFPKAFDQVVAEKKLVAKVLGPFFRDIQTSDPLFSLKNKGIKRFLMQQSSFLKKKVGELSEALEDFEDKAWVVARLDAVVEGGEAALDRKHFLQMRDPFVNGRVKKVLEHGYTFDILKKRFSFKDK